MEPLTGFDIFVLLLVGALAVLGLIRGFVTEILALLAWVAAIIALKMFYPAGRDIAAVWLGSDTGGAIAAFLVIFLVVFIVFRLLPRALGRRTRQSIVGPVDRVLGLGFGALKGLIAASLLFVGIRLAHEAIWGPDEGLPAWLAASKTEPILDVTARAIMDFARDRQIEIPEDLDGGEGYSDEDRDALDNLLENADGTDI
jgi:membrane protein required for colicin V production